MVAKPKRTQAEKLKGLIHYLRSLADMLETANKVEIGDYEYTLKRKEIPDFSEPADVKIYVDDDVDFSIIANGTFVNNDGR